MAPLTDLTNTVSDSEKLPKTSTMALSKRFQVSLTSKRKNYEETDIDQQENTPHLSIKFQDAIIAKQFHNARNVSNSAQQLLMKSNRNNIEFTVPYIAPNVFSNNFLPQSSIMLSPPTPTHCSRPSIPSPEMIRKSLTIVQQCRNIFKSFNAPESSSALSSQSSIIIPSSLSFRRSPPVSPSQPSPPLSPESQLTSHHIPILPHAHPPASYHYPFSVSSRQEGRLSRKELPLRSPPTTSHVAHYSGCLTPPPEVEDNSAVSVCRSRRDRETTPNQDVSCDEHICVSCGARFPTIVDLTGHLYVHVIEGFQAAQWLAQAFALLPTTP